MKTLHTCLSHPHRRSWLPLAAVIMLCLAPSLQAQEAVDVIVYGGTSAGITAAVEATRKKSSVLLISPEKRLGGLTSGGLGWTDIGQPQIVGGLSREFYHRVWKHYTTPEAWKSDTREAFLARPGQHVARAIDETNQVMWVFEPSAAEKVFNAMIADAGVKVIHARLDLKNGVIKEGARITSIRMEDGRVFKGSYFIDATYEGDLMAKAGVSYTVGRESNSFYGESLNGIQAAKSRQNQLPKGIDAYRLKGDPSSGLLPGVNLDPGGPDGSGDKKVQAYCYRMTLTDVPQNRVRIEKPEGYDESHYELLFRCLDAGYKNGFFKLDRMPNGKTDSNNNGGLSCDFIGMNYDYPEADYVTRERIAKAHENWQRGLVWTLQNHPRVPENTRKFYSVWGLPKDEFTDNGYWSSQLYVREARRMVGELVETERTILDTAGEKRSIGMGAYAMDSHNVQRYADANGQVRNEGDVQVHIKKPYMIDYGAITPKAAECENLLVPVALSASHIAYGSIRMEPVFMILGQSAAAAAVLALEGNLPVQKVDYQRLRAELLQGGQVLDAIAKRPDPAQTRVKSPDGKLEVSIGNRGKLSYNLTVDGRELIRPSGLGLLLRDGTEFGRDVELLEQSSKAVDTTWENPWGKRRRVADRHNELRLVLAERSASGRRFELHVRVFNDGVGLRYFLPQQPGLETVIVEQELTEFAFVEDFTCFAGQQKDGFYGRQEWAFERRQLAGITPESIIGLPLLVKTPAAWIALTESDLLNWSGMWLGGSPRKAEGVVLATKLVPRRDGEGLVKATTPHQSPWRVIMVGREAGRLIESDLVANLATPCQLTDTNWIKPGLMAWDHWWTGGVKMNTATVKEFIQLAADMGWPYQLIDWQWYGPFDKPTSDITKAARGLDMQEVLRFAKERNVRIWLWMHWADVLRNDAYLKAFPLYEQWGIAGVKIDGPATPPLNAEHQDMINLYERMTRAAAAHRLMISFHHASKPAGLNRTLPNEVTREGIMGNEGNGSRDVTPEYKIMLPFTRFLAGPGDFTPGGFINRQPDKFNPKGKPTQVQGTRAAELALFVVFDSPVANACDHPNHYRGQPGADFLKVVPTVWDETRVLEGEPGEHLLMVRQSGRNWFLGGLTDRRGRDFSLKLDFLGPGKWKLRLWQDAADSGTNAEHLDVVERLVSADDVLTLRLAPSGGVVGRFEPAGWSEHG